jgi:hypothetical protein
VVGLVASSFFSSRQILQPTKEGWRLKGQWYDDFDYFGLVITCHVDD